jgi:hypothetical protein
MGDIKVKSKLKKGQLYGFTKELYKVLEIKTKDDGKTVLYRVNDTGKRLYYLRHQLQKVETKDLIKTGHFRVNLTITLTKDRSTLRNIWLN